MPAIIPAIAIAATLLSGAIFGFFYAWVCSTLWGLDTLPPEVAIRAMQAMNASVRNIVFAPAFFGTGPALLVAALAAWRAAPRAGVAFAAGGVVYILFGMVLTLAVNVPMNRALALVDPAAVDAAAVWAGYSGPWQMWNITRTVATGVALTCALMGLVALGRGRS